MKLFAFLVAVALIITHFPEEENDTSINKEIITVPENTTQNTFGTTNQIGLNEHPELDSLYSNYTDREFTK